MAWKGQGDGLTHRGRGGRFSIGTRLFVGFLVIIVVTTVSAVVAVNRFAKLSSATGFLSQQEIPEIHQLWTARAMISEGEVHLLHLLLDHEDTPSHVRSVRRGHQVVEESLRQFRALHAVLLPEEDLLIRNVQSQYRAYREEMSRIVDLLVRGDQKAGRALLLDQWEERRKGLEKSLDLLVVWEDQERRMVEASARTSALDGRNVVAVLTLLAGGASVVLACLLTVSITRPVKKLIAATERATRGDLRSRTDIARGDEIGLLAHRFDAMLASLRDTFAQQQRFFTNASHELRTPLTIIRGEAEVTLRRPDATTDEYHEVMSRIVAVADQMGRFVDELLFLARSEAGQIEYEMAAVELASVLEEAHDQVRGLALLKGVDLKLDQNGHATVRGDAGRLRQLFLILLDNAIKYTPTGGAVTIRFEVANGSVEVIVSDTGVGISTDDLPHVFERFYRTKTRGQPSEGAGLGLSIAQSIVKAHGGEIGVRSEPGVGTTFTLTLHSFEPPVASRVDASTADRGR